MWHAESMYQYQKSLKFMYAYGIATGASRRGGLGWTCPPPLLLEVAPEIDTNPTSFYRRRGRRGVGPVKVF